MSRFRRYAGAATDAARSVFFDLLFGAGSEDRGQHPGHQSGDRPRPTRAGEDTEGQAGHQAGKNPDASGDREVVFRCGFAGTGFAAKGHPTHGRRADAPEYRGVMKVVIAGGHGKIALHLERLLAQRGDHPVGLIRDAAQEADLIAAGAHPVVIDLENTTPEALSDHLAGVDAVVFAAGAGPGSSADRKDSVDRAAAALLADAATLAGVRRYVLVSAIGSDAGPQPDHDAVFAAYITAKQAADQDLRSRDLDWTVVRPGALTEASGSGHVTLSTRVGRGSVPREDVAAVLVAVLDEPRTAGLSLDVVSGRHLIADAVAEALTVEGSSETSVGSEG